PLTAIRDSEDREPLVLGRRYAVESLRMRGVLIYQLIRGLGRPDLVKVDLMVLVFGRKLVTFFRLGIAAVIKTLALPRDSRNLHPLQRIGQYVAGRALDHAILLTGGAAERDAVGRVFAVFRKREGAESRSAVLGPFVRIDQHFRLAAEALLNVDQALVLQ